MTFGHWGWTAMLAIALAGCEPGGDQSATASPTPVAEPAIEESAVPAYDQLALRWSPGMGAAQRDFAEAAVRATWFQVCLAAGDWTQGANELASVRRKLESVQAADEAPDGVKHLAMALMPVVTHASDQLDRRDPGALMTASQLVSAFGRLTKDATVATWLAQSHADQEATPEPTEESLPPESEPSEQAPKNVLDASPAPATN